MTRQDVILKPERVHGLTDIGIDGRCIVIADRALPREVLHALPDPLLVRAGEELKTLAAIDGLAAEVLRRRSSRPMTLVAVGGGSVGDAVGFLASILWRGVELWHIPTTLIAMVDSAHGGKTAVNLGEAKNQLGTFHLPSRTIIVDQLVESLPHDLRREGMAEVLKALWLGDADAARALSSPDVERCVYAPGREAATVLIPLLEKAISVKLRIVHEDPREERGIRTVLNLGHTLGHALELTAGLGHGNAVAWGLAATLRFSAEIGLPAEDVRFMQNQLFPLLVPLYELPDRNALLDAMSRDKKHVNDQLRSVLLQHIGQPIISMGISASEWIDAFRVAHGEFMSGSVQVRQPTQRAVRITTEAGKSELNRALIIAVQRMGATSIIGRSSASDVRSMVTALRTLGYPLEETDDGFRADNLNRRLELNDAQGLRCIHAGEGGTTFRFLTALCCTSVKPTKIIAANRLLERPHEALFRSLRSGGADIRSFDDSSGRGIVVTGWKEAPAMFSVEADQSSQFATAIALLATGMEHPFTLRLLSSPVSASYLDMTLRMLRTAGVDIIAHGDLIAFNQTERLNGALTLAIEEDASSAAVWHAAAALGHPLRPSTPMDDSRQPDSAVDTLLARLRTDPAPEVVMNLTDTPDLLPVLAATAVRLRRKVRFTGLRTLRHKESDRLVAYAETLAAVGVVARVEGDELLIDGASSAIHRGGRVRTYGDHRIVMAAALLADEHTHLIIEQPWGVCKSYPAFWNDARRAGWNMLPFRDGDNE
jgi:3-phosphoshikimate 1-carboxyvinyltransferase